MRALILLLFAVSAWADDAKPVYFLQLSDTQFGMYAKDANFVQETANAEFAVATANRLKPRFIVVCGDLVNRAGDAAQIAEYKRVMGKLDPSIHVYNVAGNHDVGNQPTPESLAAYRSAFGHDWYRFEEGDFVGIVLNGSVIASPGKVPDEARKQEAWLEEQLRKAKEDHVAHLAVFIHQSFFLKSPDEADDYFNVPLAIRKRYLELFHKYDVRYVFAGHYHRQAWGKDGDLEMITTGPVSLPLGKDPSGIRIVKITSQGLEHRYFGLGRIPNELTTAADPNETKD